MNSGREVLVVEDDPAVGLVLVSQLDQAGLSAELVPSGEAALRVLELKPVDVVVTDLCMPGMDGMTLLQTITQRWPGTPVVMLTAHGTVPLAVEAMRNGAADFLLKPFEREELLFVVRKALMRAPQGVPPASVLPVSGVLGTSEKMKDALALVRRAAAGMATVLLRGESGTGKEVLAKALHALSPRRAGPLVKVNSGALPENLLESELFGYEKGAFTGAASRKPGRVELAEGGTLFLDEIGDIPPSIQVKLLRLLQEKEYERLGGTQTLKADVRFIAATHQPLEERVRRGEFREDLFYRLNVVPITVPPLRERPEDIPALAAHFVKTLGAANGKPGAALTADAISLLTGEPWPGNVRQLQNFIERLVVLSDSEALTASDVHRELERDRPTGADAKAPLSGVGKLEEHRARAERQALGEALSRANQNRTQAARLLGISRRTLYNKLEEHGLL